MSDWDTLLFDVFGTVVDERGSTRAAVASVVADPEAADRLAQRWGECHGDRVEAVAAGAAAWRPNDVLRREALLEVLEDAASPPLDDAGVAALLAAGSRMRPWPDAADAIGALATVAAVVALSNGTLAELTRLSRHGGLRWHAVLSAELAEAYKPDPAVYRMAIARLGLDPARTLMVAAHPWDLRAAAEHGLATAYVARPGEARPTAEDRFDLHAEDLADLARQLGTV